MFTVYNTFITHISILSSTHHSQHFRTSDTSINNKHKFDKTKYIIYKVSHLLFSPDLAIQYIPRRSHHISLVYGWYALVWSGYRSLPKNGLYRQSMDDPGPLIEAWAGSVGNNKFFLPHTPTLLLCYSHYFFYTCCAGMTPEHSPTSPSIG